MMDSPFFRSQFNHQPSIPVRGVPIKPVQRKPSPKVVSIPVRFVGSEATQKASDTTRSASALKIQKVFRGFLVRKSVKKISSIRDEVNEIERRILNSETVELIRRDPKERLRVNETLMALLLKLDSVRGIDSGVRDFRKAAIKKAIALQEKVDDFIAAGYQTIGTTNNASGTVDEAVDQATEIEDSASPQGKTLESIDLDSDIVSFDCEKTSEKIKEARVIDDCLELGHRDESKHAVDCEFNENCNSVMDVSECVEEIVDTDPTEDCPEYAGSSEGLIEGGEESNTEKAGAGMELQKHVVEERDDNKRNRELLEKMVEDNEKMMSLVTRVFERNEMQTRMLNSLSQRVQQLEKAFICDMLRRKKKRHVA